MPNNLLQKIKKQLGNSLMIRWALQNLEKNLLKDERLVNHSLQTSMILKEMGGDEITISVGIIHHLPKKELSFKYLSRNQREEISTVLKKFQQIKNLLEERGPSKILPIKKWQKVFLDEKAANLRKMFFAICQDVRPIFIMLGERIEELRNLSFYPQEKRIKKAITALEILSPLAYGMGMGEIKGKLEDLAFPWVYPKEYEWLITNVKEEYAQRENYLKKLKPFLKRTLKKEGINPLDIHARAKHYFSLYQKLLRYNMEIEKIYDLVALRIIVPRIDDCYKTLAILHKFWPPLPGRIKDYIASPKPNGYRSLHTTVYCQENRITEFQIKTKEMHKEAEYGVAAHLKYKGRIPNRKYRYQFFWLDQLKKWKEETKDITKLSEYLKSELFKDQIFVFTPKREIINLPKGSSPVDFAYSVHTEIGDHCQGAKVNGKLVPLDTPLETGQTVEILIDKNKTPSSDWLRFVKTQKAKQKIRSFLEKAYGISFTQKRKLNLKDKVGFIKKILPLKKEKTPQVLIEGETGISIKFSKCCNPKPGDKIVGFVTKGEGASIHKIECENLRYLKEKWPQRIVNATWSIPFSNKNSNFENKKSS